MACIPTILFWQDGFNYAVAVKQLSKVPYFLNTDTVPTVFHLFSIRGKESLDLFNMRTCAASIASGMLRDKLVKVFEATFNFSFLN